jgi:TolB-like protein/class 3 adenylate cyclase
MTEEDFRRKLAAILSADVAGYSRLMGEDETSTVRTLTAYREMISTLIRQHGGRVVDSPGDNILADFTSVVYAVQCAVAIQKELKVRNALLAQNRRMKFRIGINLGDVIEEGDRIYGDGVNIAARLEGLAEPEGICISRTAFYHIEGKLPFGYEYLGDQKVKNIARPVGAYRVLMEPAEKVAGRGKEKKMGPATGPKPLLAGVLLLLLISGALVIWYFHFYSVPPQGGTASEKIVQGKLPDKHSIAVLPFLNMSGDNSQDYFSDGLTEDLITDLSKIPTLFVVARNSVFLYKGKTVSPQQVSTELGVRYVVEGSIRKAGNRVRITAQFVDGATGWHLWAERYDRELKDIFTIQDEIVQDIVTALRRKMFEKDEERLMATGSY